MQICHLLHLFGLKKKEEKMLTFSTMYLVYARNIAPLRRVSYFIFIDMIPNLPAARLLGAKVSLGPLLN